MNFPNRDELLFRTVWAFPNASRIGFARRICSDRLERWRPPDFARGVSEFATAAKYWMTFFVFSVLPAPDSPLLQFSEIHRWSQLHSRYENALIGAFIDQTSKCLVCHGEDVGFGLLPTPSAVHVDVFSRVYRQRAVRIDCDQEQSRVCLPIISFCNVLALRQHT